MADLTVKVLQQLREEIAKLDVKVDMRADETNRRLDGLDQRVMVVEHILRDVHGQVLILNRHTKKQDLVLDDVRKRVGKLEKKGG